MKAAKIQQLRDLLNSDDLDKTRQEIDTLRREFDHLTHEEEQAQKTKFLEEGGEEELFVAETDPLDAEFHQLIAEFKRKEKELERAAEDAYQQKIATKKELIEELAHINDDGEKLNTAFNRFKVILDRWKAIGEVRGAESRHLQVEFSHLIDKFYDHVSITKALRDIDFQKNLDVKRALIIESEHILTMENLREKELALRKIQTEWNETGPVPFDKKDEVIAAFRNNTHKIFESIQEYYDARREEQRTNLGLKIQICEKIAELNARECKSHNDWKEVHESIVKLQEEWKTIGYSIENETVWQVFRNGCDQFFNNKRNFYKNLDSTRTRNAEIKQDLCEKAEGVKEDTNFNQTAKFLRDLQKTWKETGPTHRREELILWNRFRAACDHFFDAQKEFYAKKDEELIVNLTAKEDLISRIEAFQLAGNTEAEMAQLKAFANEWAAIGFVPLKAKDAIYQRYYAALDGQYDKLKLDRQQRNQMLQQNKIEEMMKSDSAGDLLTKEKRNLRDKIARVENEVSTYENNLGFFGNKGKTNPLIQEIEKKINALRREASDMKAQLKMMEQAGKKPRVEASASPSAEPTVEPAAIPSQESTTDTISNANNTEEVSVD